MTNALLWSNIAKMAENCPLFQRFMGRRLNELCHTMFLSVLYIHI